MNRTLYLILYLVASFSGRHNAGRLRIRFMIKAKKVVMKSNIFGIGQICCINEGYKIIKDS